MEISSDTPERAFFRIHLHNRREIFLGVFLVFLGFFMPLLFTVQGFRIPETLFRALETDNQLSLISAALRLIALNAIRALPHYLGAFMIAESMEIRPGKHRAWYVNAVLLIVLLIATYRGIGVIHHVYYDFGLPAVLCAVFLILFELLDYAHVALLKKSMVIAMALGAFQFLDVMPAVRGLPVGRGEISQDIKMIAAVMGEESDLNLMSMIGLVLFSILTVFFMLMLRDENRLREVAQLKEQNEEIRAQAYISAMQNRSYQEMQHLVHDLKSPLTVVETLAGTEKLRAAEENRTEDAALMERIENAIDGMNRMISEILNEDSAHPVRAGKLMEQTSSTLSIEPYASSVQFDARKPDALICVNRIMLCRALVNLVQNSAKAIPKDREKKIRVDSGASDEFVWFRVSDNGRGVPEEKTESIWERGVSGSGSSGLGLAFVKRVVEQAGGEIRMTSRPDEGTEITLMIPAYTESTAV